MLAEECRRIDRAYIVVRFDGVAPDSHPSIQAEFEKLGAMFEGIRTADCSSVVFAGGVDRPALDPSKLDAKTLEILPKLMPNLNSGDGDTLKAVATIFEDEGFKIEAPHEVLINLLAPVGSLADHNPDDADLADIERAAEIVRALGAVDVGQAAVVAQGLCLGLESLQGTDAMLAFVAGNPDQRPDIQGARGVLFKGPKPGQDLRMDMPAIGLDTVVNAAAAGLAGIAYQADAVLLLDRESAIKKANELGLFLFGRS